MTPVRLKPAALRSRVKHSTTEPLRSLFRDSDKNTDLGIVIKLNFIVCKKKQIFFLDSDQPDLSEASLSYVVVLKKTSQKGGSFKNSKRCY